MTAKDKREALEAAKQAVGEAAAKCRANAYRRYDLSLPASGIYALDATLSAVPAPVSEEEIAQWIGEARTRYTVPSAELAHEFASRLSRTEGDTEESIRTRLDNLAEDYRVNR